ncbi:MAG: SH3 domain-containing protein [Clostridiales bacterium]|jgi:hypothetical protein|nr:SH3 domain-containing protein [Clostridiales bacterium]
MKLKKLASLVSAAVLALAVLPVATAFAADTQTIIINNFDSGEPGSVELSNVIREEDHGAYGPVTYYYVYAPATITVLEDIRYNDIRKTRFDEAGDFDTSWKEEVPPTNRAGGNDNVEIIPKGSTYVLSDGVYVIEDAGSYSHYYIIVEGSSGATPAQPATPSQTAAPVATPAAENTSAGWSGAVNKTVTTALNVRSGPGVRYRVIAGFKSGDVAYVLETKDGWSKVMLWNGNFGYAYDKYLR